MIKSFSLAAMLVLVAAAFVGVAPTGAAVHVESCMEKEKECKTASVGTTYVTTSKDFVIEESEEVLDECELETTHKVTDPTSESAEDPIEVITTEAVFSNCSGSEGELEPTGLPWKSTTTESKWNETHTVELFGYGFKGNSCEWVLEAPNHLVHENTDTRFVTGYMRGAGSVWCAVFRLLTVGHTLAMGNVSDPNLTGAKDVIVN